jgi:hypothetical protein
MVVEIDKTQFALRYLRQKIGNFEYYFRGNIICLYHPDWWKQQGFSVRMNEIQRAVDIYMGVKVFWCISKERWMEATKDMA